MQPSEFGIFFIVPDSHSLLYLLFLCKEAWRFPCTSPFYSILLGFLLQDAGKQLDIRGQKRNSSRQLKR